MDSTRKRTLEPRMHHSRQGISFQLLHPLPVLRSPPRQGVQVNHENLLPSQFPQYVRFEAEYHAMNISFRIEPIGVQGDTPWLAKLFGKNIEVVIDILNIRYTYVIKEWRGERYIVRELTKPIEGWTTFPERPYPVRSVCSQCQMLDDCWVSRR
jgi:hypothetical protein